MGANDYTGWEDYMIIPRKGRAMIGYMFKKGWERYKPWRLEWPGGGQEMPPEGADANEGRVSFCNVTMPDEDKTITISLTCKLRNNQGRGAVKVVTVDVGSARSRGGGEPPKAADEAPKIEKIEGDKEAYKTGEDAKISWELSGGPVTAITLVGPDGTLQNFDASATSATCKVASDGGVTLKVSGSGGQDQKQLTLKVEAGEEPYTTIWNNAFNLNVPKLINSAHLSLTFGVSLVGTLECKTAAKPAQVAELPEEWKKKSEAVFTNKLSVPVWESYLKGGTWKPKEYGDFWSHFTLVDSSATKNGLKAETEITANIAEYDIGEMDFGALGAAPAAQAKFAVSVGQINCVKVWESAFGVATASYAVNILTEIITDGDFKLTGTWQVVGQAELKGPTVVDVAKRIAANPIVIGGLAIAATVMAVAIVLIWVENEIRLVDEAEKLPPHIAKAYSDGVWSGFSTGAEHEINEFSDGSGFTLTPYFLNGKQAGDDWRKKNPNATDDQKRAARGQALSGALEWAKDATFKAYKAQNHPADLTNEVHQRIFGTPDPDFKPASPEGGAP